MAAFTDYKALDFSGLDKSINSIAQKRSLAELGQGLDGSPEGYAKAGQSLLRLGDVSGAQNFFALGEKARERTGQLDASKSFLGALGATPQAPTSPSVAPIAALGQPNEIEDKFVGTVKQAGLTNPVGLGAVAAYGKAESGFQPQNVNRSWSDPSESGRAGTAGGIMSWRAERLQNLQNFAKERGEAQPSVETQALFLSKEDPTLIPKLQAAQTPQEANQIMANAWRFAGYNREGGENARRLALTQQYAQRFGGQTGQAPAGPAPVQVAQNEAEVQRLEAQQGNPVIPGAPVVAQTQQQGGGGTYANVPESTLNGFLNSPKVPENFKVMMRQELASRQPAQAPVQVAEAAALPGAPVPDAANMPSPVAAPVAGPGTTQAAQAQGFAIPGTSVPPNDPHPSVPNSVLTQAILNPRLPADQKAYAQRILDSRQKYNDENAPDKREMTRLQTEKLRREVEGEGAVPLTAQERSQFGIPSDQAAYKTRSGEIKFGPAGTKIINEGQKGENKFEEEMGKDQAKRFNGYIAEGDVAQGRLADIQTLRDTSRRLGSQGSSANLKATIGPFAESLGIPVEGLPDIQLYESITQRLAPTLRVAGSGSQSDIEFKGLLRAVGPLSNNPAAREMIFDTFEAASRNDIARAEIASRLAQKEISRGQAEKEIRSLPNPLEGFRKFREANPDIVGQAIKDSVRTAFEQKNAAASQPKAAGSLVAAPPAAADMLRSNPGLASDFDAKYGAGAAAKVLGR